MQGFYFFYVLYHYPRFFALEESFSLYITILHPIFIFYFYCWIVLLNDMHYVIIPQECDKFFFVSFYNTDYQNKLFKTFM